MRVFYLILLFYGIAQTRNYQHDYLHRNLPFFVMRPYTIINQTLHSYCKEQTHFKTEPMFINLTQWPSGLIFAKNPFESLDYDYYEECTIELRALIGNRIRLVFHSTELENNHESASLEYPDEQFPSLSTSHCLRIRDNDEIRMYNCSHRSNPLEYLSTSHILYLETLSPSSFVNDYEENQSYQFHIFFTSLTPSSRTGACPSASLFNCNDSYCVHPHAPCNGVEECLSKLDERVCSKTVSNKVSVIHPSLYLFFMSSFMFLAFCAR